MKLNFKPYYRFMTRAFLLVAIGSTLLFDRIGHYRWIAGMFAIAAGVGSVWFYVTTSNPQTNDEPSPPAAVDADTVAGEGIGSGDTSRHTHTSD